MGFPKGAVLFDPGRRLFHGLSSQAAAMDPAVDFAFEQSGGLEHAKVLGNCRQRHLERLRQLGDHGFAAGEARQDRPAGRVGQCAKSGVQQAAGIVNHKV